jgi:hypothetical protein
MAFDLKAAYKAASTEAQRAPFEFDWGDEHFALPPMGDWPLSISATLAAYAEATTEDINPADVVLCLRRIVGEADWDRFAAVIPMGVMPVLLEEMARTQMGATMPDLSPRPEQDSTPI